MPIRLTGMTSGLDTEALVSELVSAYRKKTDKYVKAQTKHTWKQDAWKTMSSKTYSFRSKLDSLRFSSAYNLKTTSVSNTTKASITASNSAVNGTQSLNITSLAKSGYLTGGKLNSSGKNVTGGTKLSDLGFTDADGGRIDLNGKKITLIAGDTINSLISKFKDAGVDASFDATNQRIFISAKESGASKDFSITALDANGAEALKKMGLYTKSATSTALYGQYQQIDQNYKNYANTVPADQTAMSRTEWLEEQLKTYNASQEKITNGTQAEAYLKKAADYQSAKTKIGEIEETISKAHAGGDNLVKALTSALSESSKYVDSKTGEVYTLSSEKDENGNSYYTKEGDPTNQNYYLNTFTTTTQEDELGEDGKPVKDENGNTVKKDVTTTTHYLSTTPDLDDTDQKAMKNAVEVKTADEFLKANGVDSKDVAAYRSALATTKSFDAQLEAEQKKYTDRVAELKQQFLGENENPTEEELKNAEDRAVAQAESELIPSGAYDGWRRLEDVKGMSATDIEAAQKKIAEEREAAQKFMSDNAFLSSYAKQYKEAANDTSKITQTEVVGGLEADIQYAVDRLADEAAGKRDADMGYSEGAVRVNGQDATIYLNGAQFTSSSNTFNINGLTINALATTTTEDRIKDSLADEDAVTITTATDNQGVYDKIKDFLSEYNSLINSMTASYNAANASDYEPLTDEEKEAMTDSQVEKWEEKGKSAVLRRDSTLSALMSAMTSSMSKTYSVNGKNYSLATFGIKTLGILDAEKNEQNAYHIDGDADDDSVSGNADKLMAAITNDPDGVMTFFQKLSNELYDQLGKKMTSTTMRTYGTFYNDKEMAKEYSDYTTTISKWEDKVADIEDSYYKKFAAMESALSKLQSQTSQLSGLLG